MRRRVWTVSILFASLIASGLSCLMRAAADEAAPDLTSAQVKDAIDRVQKFLGTIQNRDGSFGFRLGGPASNYGNTGVTGLVVLALLSSGLPPEHAVVADGLKFLRTAREPQDGFETYQTAVMIMALAAAKQPDRDMLRIQSLAHKLESMQITRGVRAGMWNYGHGLGLEDNSNSQFAVLGLREAAVYGVTVSRRTWELAGAHYIETQNPDGGWGYHVGQSSTGSMTCSGIGSLVICDQMLSSAEDDKNDDGTPKCCSRTPHANRALRRGIDWLGRHFAVGTNPGEQGVMWPLYFLYGVERAGRLSGQRFFGPHDWYREGAAYFVDRQSRQDGSFTGSTAAETDPVVASSFALLFLSKGLAPVLINKLNYGSAAERGRPTTMCSPIGTCIPTTYGTSPNTPAACRIGPSCSPTRKSTWKRCWLREASATCSRRPSSISAEPTIPSSPTPTCSSCGRTSSREGLSSPSRTAAARFRHGHPQPGRPHLCLGRCPVEGLAAGTSHLPGRISPRSGSDRVMGSGLRLPHVLCVCPAGPFLPVGQVVVSTGPQADAAV